MTNLDEARLAADSRHTYALLGSALDSLLQLHLAMSRLQNLFSSRLALEHLRNEEQYLVTPTKLVYLKAGDAESLLR